ncbi:MAG: DEAD/DEAH box helicase [Anaerolineae bacterium]|nr:DEAD/DEAH box helicase [Anaerolineae bacterium]
MPLTIMVTNRQPNSSREVPQPLLDLFQEFTLRRYEQRFLPFKHQAQIFRLVGAEEGEAFLVAGTAAGKTLAIGVPLFWKLQQGLSQRVLLMYPTVALLEDQRKVMDTLAEITGLEVGQLQGGMSRSQLIAALNKPVILATPDEVYWFFRKNVKYNSLLIYGLALVDEFVLDEAHLFSGLMLRNFQHLMTRIQLLARRLNRRPRLHILTATPTEELRSLSKAKPVYGRSKCGDVTVKFLEPVLDYRERMDTLVSSVEQALAKGGKKVLVVFNSAAAAHYTFEAIRGKEAPTLPVELRQRFGWAEWGKLAAWMEGAGVAQSTIAEIGQRMQREGGALFLKDLAPGTTAPLPSEELMAGLARLLREQGWALKRLAYAVFAPGKGPPLAEMERMLNSKGRLTRGLWAALKRSLSDVADYETCAQVIDHWLTEVSVRLEGIWTEETVTLTAPDFPELASSLRQAGLPGKMAQCTSDRLKYNVKLKGDLVATVRVAGKGIEKRPVALQWLSWMVKDETRRETLLAQVQEALVAGELEVQTRHIATWGDSGVPVVIYTGKMSRAERRGLIEAFTELPRAVLISTPAVEVGVDFEADWLITEECEGNGFLQRFGRVGRREGMASQVVTLVRSGSTYAALRERRAESMAREDFSTLIADENEGVFPQRTHIGTSSFLDATHYLVNGQLGFIGEWLNEQMFPATSIIPALAEELRAAGVRFAYGLRGTMPSVALRGGGGGDPFYLLQKIANEELLPTDSPFEVAAADLYYLSFLFRPTEWYVVVDIEDTLANSQVLFYYRDRHWGLQAGFGIAKDHKQFFAPKKFNRQRGWMEAMRDDPERAMEMLRSHRHKPMAAALLRLGEALPQHLTPQRNFILMQGDVYLQRVHRTDGSPMPVEDRFQNPVVIPDQLCLILYGQRDADAAYRFLQQAGVADLEEVHYDWDGLRSGVNNFGLVMVDRAVGACFHVYRRLVEHVGG